MVFKSHPTATVDDGAIVGEGTSIWHYAHIRDGSTIGDDCNLGHASYVDAGVTIGDRVKIQNKVSIYQGVTIENDVFVGPHVCFTNDMHPRAFDPEWQITSTLVKRGASIGANATIRCGVTIGEFAMVAAGAVVTKDVPDFALVMGCPAKQVKTICYCGMDIESDFPVQKGKNNVPICPHNPNLDLSRFA